MITGEVCFSTQKVRYAPVINGKNIFTDAYITKRYTITYDKITGRMSYSINNASYKSNRGDGPSMIVLNAQVFEMWFIFLLYLLHFSSFLYYYGFFG